MDPKDLKQISDLLDSKFVAYDKKMDSKFAAYDRKIDTKFVTYDKKMDIKIESKLDHRIGQLEQKMFEWKSEIINAVDGMAKEIRDEREFREVSGYQTTDNTRRIEKLERKVFGVAEG